MVQAAQARSRQAEETLMVAAKPPLILLRFVERRRLKWETSCSGEIQSSHLQFRLTSGLPASGSWLLMRKLPPWAEGWNGKVGTSSSSLPWSRQQQSRSTQTKRC